MLFSALHNLEIKGWPRFSDWEEACSVLLDPTFQGNPSRVPGRFDCPGFCLTIGR